MSIVNNIMNTFRENGRYILGTLAAVAATAYITAEHPNIVPNLETATDIAASYLALSVVFGSIATALHRSYPLLQLRIHYSNAAILMTTLMLFSSPVPFYASGFIILTREILSYLMSN
jgi:hypothetical protein